MVTVRIALREIGSGHPCFIIAEAGVNHNGQLDLALALVDAAASCGADAVKFQTFRPEFLAAGSAPKAEYQKRTTGAEESQLDMLRRLQLGMAEHQAVQVRCREKGILFLSSPFDVPSADLLEKLNVPAYKIGSGELTNLPFLENIARRRRPIILSTGMSTLQEVRTAVNVITAVGNQDLILLHCVSNYPAQASDANLLAIQSMAGEFHLPIGYSDHTQGIEVALAAVALGACIVEKHLTVDSRLPGPDQQASANPAEFKSLVNGVRRVECALGDGIKRPAPSEQEVSAVARRSLVSACRIPAGASIQASHLAVLRPGSGIPPARMADVIGRKVRTDIPEGTVLMEDMLV